MNVKKYIDWTLDTLLALILGGMSLIVAVNVFSRFVLNSSIYWGDELALVLFVWLTFLGSAVGIRDRAHYVFGYFTDRLNNRTLFYYRLTGDIISIIAISVLLTYSARVAWQINAWIMPATEISRALVYGAAPVGCLFMLYYMALHVRQHLRPGQQSHPQ